MKSSFREKVSYIWDSIKYALIKLFSSRVALLLTVFIILFSILAGRLFYLQIIKSDYYTQNFTQKAEKVITTNAARGNIYDRNGKLLAYNEISYSVVMTDEIPKSNSRGDILNGIVYRAINIIEKYGDHIIDDFNIELNNEGEYVFKSNPVTRQMTFLINIYGLTTDEIRQGGYDRLSAEDIMAYLCGPKKYDLDEEYTREEMLKIVTVRYALSLTAYQKYVSTVIAENINENTMAAILESTEDLTGVEVQENYKRVYNYPEYFAHIIGYIGEISEEELTENNLDNPAGIQYSIGDYIGKSGVEQSFDSYLQGIKGEKRVFVDATGNILEVLDESKSSSGNDLYLTLDTDLQIAAYNILEKKLAACLINKIVNYDTEAKEKQTYVYIPIKDVYHKILTNIVDFTEFSDPDASYREKQTLMSFEEKEPEVINWISSELLNPFAEPSMNLSKEQTAYMDYVYKLLSNNGIINTSLINKNDSIYKGWEIDETVSLREFLQHAIAENWIDVTAINATQRYSNSDEVFEAIVDNVVELLPQSREFQKLIYYYMVYSGVVTPYDICMMMYDQEKISKDALYERLSTGALDTYTYVISEIQNLVLTPAMLALDPCSGGLCMTDIDTGKVLALVSYPTFDNNKLSGSVDSQYWYELNTNDSQPLFNYATSAITAPGSTFKLCTSVAGLAEGFITPETVIHDDVEFKEISPSPKCYITPASHGDENLAGAIRDSCNYFFFQIGYDMGLDQYGEYNSAMALDIIDNYAIQLGLGVKSGVEIPEREPRVSTTDSVRTAIGQGTNGYASVHMNRYVNTIANNGNNYRLSLIDRVESSDGRVVLKVVPELTNVVELPQEDWDAIHYGMRLVTQSGTASSFFTELHTSVAGKTGTAEENKYRSNHAAFVGYAPYEDPEISFACMIRNCDSTSYPGGVLSDVLQYYYGQTTFEEVLAKPVENTIAGFHSE